MDLGVNNTGLPYVKLIDHVERTLEVGARIG